MFSIDLRGIGTRRRWRPVGAIPPKGLEYWLKRSVTIDLIVGSRSNFSGVFGGYLPWNCVDSELQANGVRSGRFQ